MWGTSRWSSPEFSKRECRQQLQVRGAKPRLAACPLSTKTLFNENRLNHAPFALIFAVGNRLNCTSQFLYSNRTPFGEPCGFRSPNALRKDRSGILCTMISKTAEYALRAAACMGATPDQPISANALAKQTKVPRRYLTRVLQDLCEAGLVQSRPGPGGGYELTRSTAKITILDVINKVDPIQRIKQCPLGLKTHTKLCPLHAELDCAYAATEKAFKSVTIKQLVESTSPIVPLCESGS